ncbi:hypothetical protein [Paenibacillus lautus]|uniref:hypothetical protein n=1 Tax=Paenibacillus lautus TaxID=1401 RepID=UPI001C7CA26D|nr:hypothetical protein [Paenibacillus lautus]MBX4152406.1 hypothetical protein [Paenibacillus lautus]
MDFTEVFKKKGFKYKYSYMLGDLGKPETIEIVDAWEKDLLNPKEMEAQKRRMMKEYQMPVINVEIEEI